jgi:N-acetyl-anhydromuramyl-L-alanine amidase AmpD
MNKYAKLNRGYRLVVKQHFPYNYSINDKIARMIQFMNRKLLIIISIAFFTVIVFLAVNFWPKKISEIQIQSSALIDAEENKGSESTDDLSEPENAEEVSDELTAQNDTQATSAVTEEKKSEEVKTETPEVKARPEEKAADFKINNKIVSWGHQKASGRKVDTIIIHSSYNALDDDKYDLDKILDIYKSYGVAPHYIVTREGKIYQLVEDKNIAYHAGESKVPDGRTGVNDFSIGIEIINNKTEGPSQAQYENLKKLVAKIKGDYNIKYVLGHSDIAPGRKDDPWKFDWKKVR